MRSLIAMLIVLPLLWSGYWLFGSYGLKSEIEDWLSERKKEGWQVEYSDLKVRGFPNRFDTTLEAIHLSDDETNLSWSAPFFQLLALSYKPNHLIAVWPNQHSFSTLNQKIDVTSTDMKASLVLTPDQNLTLLRGTLISNDLSMSSNTNWQIAIDEVATSLRQLDDPKTYEMSFKARSLKPSNGLRDWLGVTAELPQTIENLSVNFSTELTSSIDRLTIETARPQIRSLDISQVSASWGLLLLDGSGQIQVADDGNLNGDLSVSAQNWRKMLEVATSSGVISAEVATAAEFGLSLLAGLGGSQDTLNTSLSLRDGRMFLGPVPLGVAPKLIIP